QLVDILNSLSDDELKELATHTEQLEHLRQRNPLDFFEPYPKQREFLKLGLTHRERLFMAGNRVGKSQTGTFEDSCHATGNYPEWFDGKRFSRRTTGWVCGPSGQNIRDVGQYKLLV